MPDLDYQPQNASQVHSIFQQMFNAKLNKFEYIAIAMMMSKLVDIPLKFQEKRCLTSLLHWFVNNWTAISPYLRFVVMIKADGEIVQMK
jgi:hypothetical protein